MSRSSWHHRSPCTLRHARASTAMLRMSLSKGVQIDLADFTTPSQPSNGFRYAFVAVDVFSKYMWIMPCNDKMPDGSVRAFTNALDQIGTPKQTCHDNEGAWISAKFIKLPDGRGIKQIISSSP